jgi:hypothetical protein
MPLHSGKRLAVRLVAFGAACVVVVMLVAWWSWREPSYNGHSLSYWFQRLPVLTGEPNFAFEGIYAPPQGAALDDCRMAMKAMKAMGPNALPYLIHKLQARRPLRPVERLCRRAQNWPVVGKLVDWPDVRKDPGRALAGLLVLSPLPPDADRKVRDLSLDFKGPCWELAGIIVKAQNDPRVIEDNLSTRQFVAGQVVTIRYSE